MKTPPLPLVDLLAVQIVANCFIFTTGIDSWKYDIERALFIALVFAQASLLATWFTLSTRNILSRLAILIGSVFLVAEMDVNSIFQTWLSLLLASIALLSIPRAIGYRWVLASKSFSGGENLGPRKFSVQQLLTWTAAVAVIMVVVTRTWDHWRHVRGQPTFLLELYFAVPLQFLLLVPVVLALPRPSTILTYPLVILVMTVGGILAIVSADVRVILLTFVFTNMAIQCIWILTARACGYRIARCQGGEATPQTSNIDPWFVGLVALHAVADVVVYRSLDTDSFSTSVVVGLGMWVLLGAQAGLLAVWFMLGSCRFLVRLAAVAGGVVFLTGDAVDRSGFELIHMVVIAQFVVTAALAGALRIVGFQWVFVSGTAGDEIRNIRPFEFRELLGWTVAAVVVIFAIRQMQRLISEELYRLPSLLLCACLAGGLSLLPLVLATRRARIPLLLQLVFVLLAAGVTGGILYQGPPATIVSFIAFSLLQCTWILTVRACGYRLMRSQRRAAAEIPTPPDVDPWSADATE